jgi:alkanesulfonate monooxygenase SsuD/methylene tetrahydromethanopterin reductase-like flavin-dependent oxidoreductase (luciferase family)
VSADRAINFYMFTNCGYNVIPPDNERFASTWVDYPNSEFDPQVGHDLYQRHLRTIRLAEELGFDGVAVNEHHNTQFSMTPAVSVMAAAVIMATSRVRIQVAGVPINLSYPNRIAEEYAMLDVLSGGRMEFAFPLGTGMEYWANAANIAPTTARARFREGIEVILQCWTQDGPTSYHGEFFTYRYLNPWPRPMQKPHPKIFIVGSGSAETVQLAAEFGAGYSIVMVPVAAQDRAFDRLRELAAKHDHPIVPNDIVIVVPTYVAETDDDALREGRPYMEKFWSWQHRVPPKFLTPPGYVSTEEFFKRASDATVSHEQRTSWEDMTAGQRIALGSPETVARLIVEWARSAQCGRFNIVMEHADMPEWMVIKNMTLFTREVIPRVRALMGTPEAGAEPAPLLAGSRG